MEEESFSADTYTYEDDEQRKDNSVPPSDPEWQIARSPGGSKIKYSFKTGEVRHVSPSPERLWMRLTFPDGREAEVHRVTKEFRYVESTTSGHVTSTVAVAPPAKGVPGSLHKRLAELETLSAEAKQWQKADDGKRSYWYKVGTKHSLRETSNVIGTVTAHGFKKELDDLRRTLKDLQGKGAAPAALPPPPPPAPQLPTHPSSATVPGGTAAIGIQEEGGQDWRRAKIPRGPALQAEMSRFENACETKGLSLHQAASFYIVFASSWPSEVELIAQANAMGFPNLEAFDGEVNDNVQRIPPFIEENPAACAYVPQWNLVQTRVPLRKFALELITSGNNSGTASIRSSRYMVMNNLESLLAFFGRFSGVNAQKGPRGKKAVPPSDLHRSTPAGTASKRHRTGHEGKTKKKRK